MFNTEVVNLSSKLPGNRDYSLSSKHRYSLRFTTEESHRIRRKPRTFKDACTETCFKLSKNLEDCFPLLGRGKYKATFWASESLSYRKWLLPYYKTHAQISASLTSSSTATDSSRQTWKIFYMAT